MIDSLTDRFERQAVEGVPPDTMRSTLDQLWEARADSSKMLFLEARLMRAVRDYDSSRLLMKRLDRLVDTTGQSYLWQRMKCVRSHAVKNDVEQYVSYSILLDYFRDVNDSLIMAGVLVDISNLMSTLKDPMTALESLTEAQEIYRSIDMPVAASRCDINLLNIYLCSGDTIKADSVCRRLLKDPTLPGDTLSYCLALLNAYNTTDSVDLLYKADAIVKGKENMKHFWPIFSCLIGDRLLRDGEKDSAYRYIQRAHELLPYNKDMAHRGHFTRSYVSVLQDKGLIDSAYHYLLLAERQNDTLMSYMDGDRVHSLEANRKLAEIKEGTREKMMRERQLWTLAIIAAIVTIIASAWIAYHKQHREKMRAMQAQLELDRSLHQLAARVLAMEEKDRVLSAMSAGLKEIGDNPQDSRSAARELENMIKLHVSGQEEWQNFITLFESVHPKFMTELKRQFPDMKEHYVKLAAYIHAGLTNPQIARMLMIRPESVHQARWRLRKKLGIPSDISLEDALRSLADTK